MYCIKCGTKNEDDSKFCINCGEKLEEQEQPMEQEKPKEVETTITKEEPKEKSSVNPLLIIIPIVAVVFMTAVILLGYNIYNTLNTGEKTQKITPSEEIKDDKSWEFTYKIPKEFTTEDYSSDSLKFYKYKDDDNFCSLSIMKVSYIEEGTTEEELMKKYSNIEKDKLDKIKLEEKEINGTTYKEYKTESEWYNRYEYGKLNSSKTAFYSFEYADYSPENKLCEKKLKEILKTFKYKEKE